MSDERGYKISATIKGQGSSKYDAPWIVVYGDTPEEVKALVDGVLDVGLDGTLAAADAAFKGTTNAAMGLGARPVADPGPRTQAPPWDNQVSGSPVQSVNVGPAQGAAAGGLRTETNKWGNKFTHDHPAAPILPVVGKAVLREWTDNNNKPRARWVDPRDPAIPSVYEANGKEKPADLWEGDWAKV